MVVVQVSVSSILVEQRQDVDVHFIPPFMSSHKLHTANTSKFLQVRKSFLLLVLEKIFLTYVIE